MYLTSKHKCILIFCSDIINNSARKIHSQVETNVIIPLLIFRCYVLGDNSKSRCKACWIAHILRLCPLPAELYIHLLKHLPDVIKVYGLTLHL